MSGEDEQADAKAPQPPVDPLRSDLMRRVGRRDTKPEMVVRRILHALGLRFRLQAAELPGTPDVVFRNRRIAVFVHGCFWHRHPGCRLASTPKTRTDFWSLKFARNVARDRKVVEDLEGRGWNVVTVWECETRKPLELTSRLRESFGNKSIPGGESWECSQISKGGVSKGSS